MNQTTPAPRVIPLKWGHVEKDWIETTNCPFQYSVLLDDEVAQEGEDSAPFMLMLAPNTKLGMFGTMENAMDAAQADLAFRVAALCDPAAPAGPAIPVCQTVFGVERETLERSVVVAARAMVQHLDRIETLEVSLRAAVALLEGDATGLEWKRQVRAFTTNAKRLLQRQETP